MSNTDITRQKLDRIKEVMEQSRQDIEEINVSFMKLCYGLFDLQIKYDGYNEKLHNLKKKFKAGHESLGSDYIIQCVGPKLKYNKATIDSLGTEKFDNISVILQQSDMFAARSGLKAKTKRRANEAITEIFNSYSALPASECEKIHQAVKDMLDLYHKYLVGHAKMKKLGEAATELRKKL